MDVFTDHVAQALLHTHRALCALGDQPTSTPEGRCYPSLNEAMQRLTFVAVDLDIDLDALEGPPEITPHEASIVLWQFGHSGGYSPSNFIALLLNVLQAADTGNLARFAKGFPGYVEAVRLAKFEPGGIERLQRIAATLDGRPT